MSKEAENLFTYKTTELPTREELSSGTYKYVRIGKAIILLNLDDDSWDHFKLSAKLEGQFNQNEDDADVLTLEWSLSTVEIDSMINREVEFNSKQGKTTDTIKRRKTLTENFGNTSITLSKSGSSSLKYEVKPKNRETTITLLQTLFPNSEVTY